MISHRWHLKHNTMNLSRKQKQTHRQREQNCGCQGGGWGVVKVMVFPVVMYGCES